MSEGEHIPKRVTGSFVAVILIAFAVLSALAYFVNETRNLSRQNEQRIAEAVTAQHALCALRADLDKRIESSEKFLHENPNGIPGIPASLIRQTLNNSRRTRTALNVLDCGRRRRSSAASRGVRAPEPLFVRPGDVALLDLETAELSPAGGGGYLLDE